eukprot:scpid105054/ scgid35249/ 
MEAREIAMKRIGVKQERELEASCEVRETDIDADLPVRQSSQGASPVNGTNDAEMSEIISPHNRTIYDMLENTLTGTAVEQATGSPPPAAKDAALLEQNALERTCAPLCARVSTRMYRSIMIFGFVILAGIFTVFIYYLVKLLMK